MFCFDARFYNMEVEKYSTKKAGLLRTKFHIETVKELRERLKAIGTGLLVYNDKPENVLPKLISKGRYTTVVYSREICPNELYVEKEVRKGIRNVDANAIFVGIHSNFLYHVDDVRLGDKQL